MKRLLLLMLALCMALVSLPAAAERENFTEGQTITIAPGEVRTVEIGDVMSNGLAAVYVKNEKGHGMISVGQMTRWIILNTIGGSIIANCGDVNVTADIAEVGELYAKDGGFVSLRGKDFRTENGQGLRIKATEASAVRVRIGEIECKGPNFGLYAELNDGSTLMMNAKKLKYDGEMGLWLQIRGQGKGDEIRASISIDELEGTKDALDLQQYNSGYYSVLRFGKVTAGNIGLKLMPERGTATDILVEGDINSGRVGVRLFSDDTIKLIVLGTINAPEAPIMVVNMSGKSGVGVNSETQGILVWRIIPTASGHTVMLEGGNETAVESASTEVLEKAIRYIIRTEESDKATFTLMKEDGEEIRMSFGYPVACEGERVLVEAQAADGYTVTGVMNGEDEKVPLEQDENGNWYFDMPRGGGISLFAVIEPAN